MPMKKDLIIKRIPIASNNIQNLFSTNFDGFDCLQYTCIYNSSYVI